jgi:hypothetical protein
MPKPRPPRHPDPKHGVDFHPQADSPNTTDLSALRRDLRDLFEGCIPFREAIQMTGAADHPDRKALTCGGWREIPSARDDTVSRRWYPSRFLYVLDAVGGVSGAGGGGTQHISEARCITPCAKCASGLARRNNENGSSPKLV